MHAGEGNSILRPIVGDRVGPAARRGAPHARAQAPAPALPRRADAALRRADDRDRRGRDRALAAGRAAGAVAAHAGGHAGDHHAHGLRHPARAAAWTTCAVRSAALLEGTSQKALHAPGCGHLDRSGSNALPFFRSQHGSGRRAAARRDSPAPGRPRRGRARRHPLAARAGPPRETASR